MGRVMENLVTYPSTWGLGLIPKVRSLGLEATLTEVSLYASPVKVSFGPLSAWIVSDPDWMGYILCDNVSNYGKPNLVYDGFRMTVGSENLVVSSGSFWSAQRKLISPFFHRRAVTSMIEQMVKIVDKYLHKWDQYADYGTTFNLDDELSAITLRIILGTMLRDEFVSEALYSKMQDAADYITDNVEGLSYIMGSIFPWLLIPGKRRFSQQAQVFRSIISSLVDRVDIGAQYCGIDPTNLSLVEMLLLASDDDDDQPRINREQLLSELIAIFMAGYETLATTLSWLFGKYLPEMERNAQQSDLYGAFLNECVLHPTPTDLSTGMATIGNFVNEVLRIAPAAPLTARYTLCDDEFQGISISAGTNILLYTFGLHRNGEYWENPDKFDPTRFVRNDFPSGAFLPFSTGQRKYLGFDFALTEAKIIVSMLLSRYVVDVVDGNPAIKMGGILRPVKPFRVRLTSKV
ncbi:MAG: cytochrome P450 [Chloroflexota bacterium]